MPEAPIQYILKFVGEWMPCTYLSYREEDAAAVAERLRDSLGAAFGRDIAFAEDENPEGRNGSAAQLAERLGAADALLVLIGPRWLELECSGGRCLDQEDDPVRIEIETALNQDKTVIPLLLEGARMPDEHELPASIAPLARRRALDFADATWTQDVERLATALKPRMPVVAGPPRQQTPSSRLITGALLGLLALLGAFLLTSQFWLPDPPEAIGRWGATVVYEDRVTHDERFEFRLTGRNITGTATYRGQRRVIEDARVDGDQLAFLIRTRELVGNQQREVRHHYNGVVENDTIRFVIETAGGFRDRDAVEFEAQRR